MADHFKGMHRVQSTLNDGTLRVRYYAWRRGPCFWTNDGAPLKPPYPSKFKSAFDAAKSAANASIRTEDRGRIKGVIEAYKSDHSYLKNKAITRREYDRSLAKIEEKFGRAKIGAFKDPRMRREVKKWHQSFAVTPRQADMHLGVLVKLLNFAKDEGDISGHCAEDIDRIHTANRASIIWEPDEFALLGQHCMVPSIWPILTAGYSGLRRTDIVTMPKTADKGDHLNWWTSKSNGMNEVVVPIVSEFRQILDQANEYRECKEEKRGAECMTLFCNSLGRAYSPDGLSTEFQKARSATGVDKRFHDLKGTAVHNFVQAGFKDDEIAEIVGWSTNDVKQIRRRYADRKVIVLSAISRLERNR
ncbi:tyrosine-type recombinase/integrase [Roseibium sp. Sym1]|uniref:tyrosine-type recombinase/integrase n=1 Tax=Roseibium sp. Sym1 TaxID=3016006 RepID=UPI0022B314BC|nr:tyrosine-type recombinase/integrase [Roseibium sp. Sym1]